MQKRKDKKSKKRNMQKLKKVCKNVKKGENTEMNKCENKKILSAKMQK